MSQLISKKSRIEIPPLNWKAPDTRPDPEIIPRPADTEPSEDKRAAHAPA
ncbi:hypothetical protein LMG3458_02922 [Achromobacter deleyi]|uniref:Uncharacterized protein n=1 Tax=Achromobacter deleyi TaxID=1353891 RepID=A0A6S7AW02_9BURK|nr:MULTISPECIES: hypothetical protein [Achromobacter]CAB3705902.1 hypothetical protein LMG3458_02922 [Achromobacter deleyi]CAB3880562.1 hypothetical protein LMG3482_03272 [Achromobacter deleyi]CAB3927531.1 hypothetical protein LMG3481_06056 [Achromobacter deleyi]CAB3928611.1 hypothetical protein LMG3412_06251 [Achromobacter deleyi]